MPRGRSPVQLDRRLFTLTVAVFLGLVDPAPAQPTPPPPSAPEDLAERAPIHVGPFYFQPWVALTHAGYDTNIFNESEDPKSDVTFTLTPALDGGMRAGVARLNFRLLTDFVWYNTFTSEGGWDPQARLEFELRSERLRPYVSAEWTNTRSRPGYEVDARAERNLPVYGGGVDLRVVSRTWVVASYRQARTEYLVGETYQSQPLDEALNNTTRTMSAGGRFELTPFVNLSLLGQAQQVRFDEATFRDNDSFSVLPTLDLKPEALLSGRVVVGYRAFTPTSASVPDFRGAVIAVQLRSASTSDTSVGIGLERDVAYSYDDDYPYYLLSGIFGAVAHRVVGSFEVTGQARRQWLDYRVVRNLANPRIDRVTQVSAGVGYRIGDLGRAGFDVEWARRRSDLPDREYEGVRMFGSIRYGL